MAPALDSAQVEQLMMVAGDDIAWVRDLYDLFFANTRAGLDELEAIADSRDAERIHRLVHGLKGQSANLGARNFEGICQVLIEQVKAQDFSRVHEMAREMRAEFARVEIATQELFGSPV